MNLPPDIAIWKVPMAQISLVLRQKKLHDDPKGAWTFSDEEFLERIKGLI